MALSVLNRVVLQCREDNAVESPFLLIGNPGNKRTNGLQAARSKLGLTPAAFISYESLLTGSVLFVDVLKSLAGRGTIIIRLDAPGEDPIVERELIAWGAANREGNDAYWYEGTAAADRAILSSIPAEEALKLPLELGRIYYPAQWYRGYCRFLAALQHDADFSNVEVQWVNAPAVIAAMFDKRNCWQLMSRLGVSLPALPAPAGTITDYDTLQAAIASSGMTRLFIKLACGSGASGVIAYQTNPKTGAELAITTIGIEERVGEPIFYNAGRMRRYRDSAVIRRIVDWLCQEGVHIERWIEKENVSGKSFDVRQLMVNGKPCHTVLRLSSTPITNLHLRNERKMNVDELLSSELKQSINVTAAAAMSAFPGASIAGVDVLVQRGSGATYAIDINPFGDLLYGVEFEGMNTYEWQTDQLLRRE